MLSIFSVDLTSLCSVVQLLKLEGMVCSAGQPQAPAESFGQGRGLFSPILPHFWCSVITLVTLSRNLNKKNPTKSKTIKKYIQIIFPLSLPFKYSV